MGSYQLFLLNSVSLLQRAIAFGSVMNQDWFRLNQIDVLGRDQRLLSLYLKFKESVV